MATSIHAAKTYKVEYGADVSDDLYRSAINGILDELSEEFTPLDGNDAEYSEHAEITVVGMIKVIGKVSGMSEEEFKTLYDEHQEYSDVKDLTKDEFLKDMQRLYNEADKSDGFIHLMWF